MAGRFNLFAKFSLFRAKPKMRGENVRRYIVTNPYHAVSILPSMSACQESKNCAEKRYLSADAPALPLKGCDAKQCRCRYVHHEDRRTGLRRTADANHFQNHYWRGQERRSASGRRITDL